MVNTDIWLVRGGLCGQELKSRCFRPDEPERRAEDDEAGGRL